MMILALSLSEAFKLIDATRGVIYDRRIFIVQATGERKIVGKNCCWEGKFRIYK